MTSAPTPWPPSLCPGHMAGLQTMRSSLTFPHCPKPPSLVEASLPGQGAHQQIRVGGGGGNNGGGLDQTGFPAQVSPLNPPEPEPSLSPLSHRSVGGRPQTPLLPTPPPGFTPPPPATASTLSLKREEHNPGKRSKKEQGKGSQVLSVPEPTLLPPPAANPPAPTPTP